METTLNELKELLLSQSNQSLNFEKKTAKEFAEINRRFSFIELNMLSLNKKIDAVDSKIDVVNSRIDILEKKIDMLMTWTLADQHGADFTARS